MEVGGRVRNPDEKFHYFLPMKPSQITITKGTWPKIKGNGMHNDSTSHVELLGAKISETMTMVMQTTYAFQQTLVTFKKCTDF